MDIFSLFRKKKKFDAQAESKNIVESIAKCKSLHKELIKLTHPDKNPSKLELAEELTQLVNKNRHNYAELIKLETRIKKELL